MKVIWWNVAAGIHVEEWAVALPTGKKVLRTAKLNIQLIPISKASLGVVNCVSLTKEHWTPSDRPACRRFSRSLSYNPEAGERTATDPAQKNVSKALIGFGSVRCCQLASTGLALTTSCVQGTTELRAAKRPGELQPQFRFWKVRASKR